MKSFSVQANATIAKKIKGYAEMQMKLNDTTNVLQRFVVNLMDQREV
jgi:hypothetical protein